MIPAAPGAVEYIGAYHPSNLEEFRAFLIPGRDTPCQDSSWVSELWQRKHGKTKFC